MELNFSLGTFLRVRSIFNTCWTHWVKKGKSVSPMEYLIGKNSSLIVQLLCILIGSRMRHSTTQNKLRTNENSIHLLPVKRIIPWSVTLNFESLYPQPFHFKTSDLKKKIFDIQTQVVVGMHYKYSLFYIKLLSLPFMLLPTCFLVWHSEPWCWPEATRRF